MNVNRIKNVCKNNNDLQKEYALLYALDLDKKELIEFAERTDNKMVKKYKDEITKLNDDTIVIKALTYEEDQEMLMNAIKEDYLEEGHELGVNQTKLETAKKLLEMNMSLDNIVSITGLEKEKLLKLKYE